MAAPCARCCRCRPQVRALHPPARRARPAPRPIRFVLLEDLILLFLDRLFPGFIPAETGPVPPDPRHRRGVRGGGRGPRALLRDRAEAPPPRPRRSACRVDRRACRPTCSDFVAEELRCRPRSEVFVVDGLLGLVRPHAADRGRPAGPAVHALHAALPRTHPRFRRRLLRGDRGQGHRRPPPLRELRRGGAVPAPGGARPERGRDQADALPHHAATARSPRR